MIQFLLWFGFFAVVSIVVGIAYVIIDGSNSDHKLFWSVTALLTISLIASAITQWLDVTRECCSFETPTLLGIVSFMITVVVVPCILLAIQGLSWYIVRLPSKSENQKISKTYALWLGWGLFVLIVILNLFTDFFVPRQSLNAFGAAWLYIFGGFVAGFALIAAVHKFLEARAISVFVLILTSASISALYFYVFVDRLREAILVSSVSLLVGALAYVVLYPDVVRSLRPQNPR